MGDETPETPVETPEPEPEPTPGFGAAGCERR